MTNGTDGAHAAQLARDRRLAAVLIDQPCSLMDRIDDELVAAHVALEERRAALTRTR
jgi:hypothetical protein